jgi:mono/diheme cytochrome c family protein
MLLVGNEATGQWMRNSSLDNPKFLARTIGDWLTSWRGPRRALKSYAEAPEYTFSRGEYTFRTHCSACHTVGAGVHIGPDLAGVTKRRSREWLSRFIREPDRMRAERDPIAVELADAYKSTTMPNLALSPEAVEGVIAFLDSSASAAPPAETAATSTAAAAPSAEKVALSTAVVDAYLRIQEALSADRVDGVGEAARTIAAEATSLGPPGHELTSAASGLQQSEDLSSARVAFGRLSAAIVTIAGASSSDLGDGVNVAYCPMAGRSWLQRGTAIRNPYYGRQMLECGRLTTTAPTSR